MKEINKLLAVLKREPDKFLITQPVVYTLVWVELASVASPGWTNPYLWRVSRVFIYSEPGHGQARLAAVIPATTGTVKSLLQGSDYAMKSLKAHPEAIIYNKVKQSKIY